MEIRHYSINKELPQVLDAINDIWSGFFHGDTKFGRDCDDLVLWEEICDFSGCQNVIYRLNGMRHTDESEEAFLFNFIVRKDKTDTLPLRPGNLVHILEILHQITDIVTL